MRSSILMGLMSIFLIGNASAQTDKATTAKIIADKSFVFVATTAIPTSSTDLNNVLNQMSPAGGAGGGSISLTGGTYDFLVSKDSLVAYLPYYGRSYRATIGNEDNGHKFTSKNFTYDTKKKKKSGWDILITTKDVNDNVRMNLSVGESGYAVLSVTSNNKQAITYNGYLMEQKKRDL